jgi:hypothetical protein
MIHCQMLSSCHMDMLCKSGSLLARSRNLLDRGDTMMYLTKK